MTCTRARQLHASGLQVVGVLQAGDQGDSELGCAAEQHAALHPHGASATDGHLGEHAARAGQHRLQVHHPAGAQST